MPTVSSLPTPMHATNHPPPGDAAFAHQPSSLLDCSMAVDPHPDMSMDLDWASGGAASPSPLATSAAAIHDVHMLDSPMGGAHGGVDADACMDEDDGVQRSDFPPLVSSSSLAPPQHQEDTLAGVDHDLPDASPLAQPLLPLSPQQSSGDPGPDDLPLTESPTHNPLAGPGADSQDPGAKASQHSDGWNDSLAVEGNGNTASLDAVDDDTDLIHLVLVHKGTTYSLFNPELSGSLFSLPKEIDSLFYEEPVSSFIARLKAHFELGTREVALRFQNLDNLQIHEQTEIARDNQLVNFRNLYEALAPDAQEPLTIHLVDCGLSAQWQLDQLVKRANALIEQETDIDVAAYNDDLSGKELEQHPPLENVAEINQHEQQPPQIHEFEAQASLEHSLSEQPPDSSDFDDDPTPKPQPLTHHVPVENQQPLHQQQQQHQSVPSIPPSPTTPAAHTIADDLVDYEDDVTEQVALPVTASLPGSRTTSPVATHSALPSAALSLSTNITTHQHIGYTSVPTTRLSSPLDDDAPLVMRSHSMPVSPNDSTVASSTLISPLATVTASVLPAVPISLSPKQDTLLVSDDGLLLMADDDDEQDGEEPPILENEHVSPSHVSSELSLSGAGHKRAFGEQNEGIGESSGAASPKKLRLDVDSN